MVTKAINSLRGSVRIRVSGAATERFLNLCASRDIRLWEVKKTDIDIFYASVSLDDFFLLRPHARKSGCKVKVIKKKGAPFIFRRYSRRYALWIMGLLCVACAVMLSNVVWTIDINGCEKLSQHEVLELLEAAGLKTGVRTSTIDSAVVRDYIIERCEDVISLAVNIKGSHAQVELRERIPKPDIIPKEQPCDVVSGKSGLIVGLRVREGVGQLQIGQTVEKGELLSSGTIVSKLNETTLVHAEAEADLRTWQSVQTAVQSDSARMVETGKAYVRRALVFGRRRINLYAVESAPFSCYYIKVEKHDFTIADNMHFPISIICETYIECEQQAAQVDGDKLSTVLEQRMTEAYGSQNPNSQVEKIDFRFERHNGVFLGILDIQAIEKTGLQVPIGTAGGVQSGANNQRRQN